jgi:hypothetical protein
VLRQPLLTDPGALRRHLAARQPPQCVPAAIFVRKELPLTRNGKVAYTAIADMTDAPQDAQLREMLDWIEQASDEAIASRLSVSVE